MSESLRNDGRVWVPRAAGDRRAPGEIPEAERDYYLERMYPRYGNLTARDVASRAAKRVCDEGRGIGGGRAVYLDLGEAVARLGASALRERYGNLFELYQRITGDDPLRAPMRIYPAAHYSMGGLWVDYDLMSTLPGLFVLGEANFSDHGANRLGASALMQGLADGYFIAPPTIGNYLASCALPPISADAPEVRAALHDVEQRIARLLRAHGRRGPAELHRALGEILWRACGRSRERAQLARAEVEIGALRAQFAEDLCVSGTGAELNQTLEQATRVEDLLALGQLMCRDAREREESCGCHFRVEHARENGECKRDDDSFAHIAAYRYGGPEAPAQRAIEPLGFEAVTPGERSYA